MQAQTDEEHELARLIVGSLDLENVNADDIDPEEPLFGDGLGLDSIDALEIALTITQKYSIQMKVDDDDMQQVFNTLRSLNAYIQEKLT
jgi:acyl carrier protein